MDMVMEMNQIAEYILQKLGDRIHDRTHLYHIITTDGELYTLGEYEDLIDEGSNVSSAYIFVLNQWFSYDPRWYHLLYYYPFIDSDLLIDIYLRKYHYYRNQFCKLKYIAIITHFSSLNQTAIEVVDVDVVENNINLKELLQVLNKNKENKRNEGIMKLELDFDEQGRLWLTIKEDDEDDEGERIKEFRERLESQRLFDGYSFNGAIEIIKKYHGENDKSLADIVKTITDAYYRIFQPYRIELSPNH